MMNTLLRSAGFALAFTLAGAVHAAQDADDFVEDASAKGVAEVEAAKLAQEKGTAADVKTFSAMMLKDHGAANEKLKALAASKKLEVSTDADLIDKAKAMILELRGPSRSTRPMPTTRSMPMRRRSSCSMTMRRMARMRN